MDTQEKNIFILALILVLGIGSILLFFFRSIIRQQKEKLELKKQNIIAELKSIEKDRARIAADLHDDLAPMLSAVKMRINSIDPPTPVEQSQLEKANLIIDELALRMREISFDLMPSSLQQNGFVPALRELISSFKVDNKLSIQLSVPETPIELNEHKSIHLYRIVKEIIHNTVKHAQATELQIILQLQASTLLLTTQDNGKGFDYDKKRKKEHGLGLSSLENRITLLEGSSTVVTSPQQGTFFLFEIPLK